MTMNEENGEMLGLIVTHGDFARELLNTAKLIVGDVQCCRTLSNTGLSDDVLIGKIRDILDEDRERDTIIFVDYFGGSCSMNCLRAVKGYDRAWIISGVNLPIILDFITKQGTMDPQQVIGNLIRRGQESVKVIDM
ncbi:MAG: hypothetical protein JW814_04185 [Candidatus Krumholzibacteriota bacterium]|nr:hypothetical protein [Candidatus Krumholzibacteriota bacterium]